MVATPALHGMAGAERRPVLAAERERRRLIYVVAEAGGARVEQRAVLVAPPAPRVGVGEVGERCPPRPHDATHHPSVRKRAEPTLGRALVVNLVAALLL